MLPEILLIASLCNVTTTTDCNVQVLDEWQTVNRDMSVNAQSFSDAQADCLGSQFEADNTVLVDSFQCYKMVVDDAQGFTVQSLSTGEMITIFYDDFRGNYGR